MKNIILILLISVFVTACNNQSNNSSSSTTSSSTAVDPSLANYKLIDFPDSDFQKAFLYDGTGNIVEEGEVLNGQKTGTWITYHNNGKLMANTITNYVNGKKNGLYVFINDRNQMETIGYYLNDQQDGRWVSYKYTRRTTDKTYKNGKLNGFSRTFYDTGKDGQVQEESEWKNGVQDGIYRYYQEDGTMIMDYLYKDGQKVEGKAN